MALVKFTGGPAGAPVIEKNPFNDNEEREAFDQMVEEICADTIRQRFSYALMYKDITALSSVTFANKYNVYRAKKARSGDPIVFKLKTTSHSDAAAAAAEFNTNMFEAYFCKKLCTKCHPNIVQLNQVWAVRKFHEVYIELEACETSLAHVILKFKNRLSLSMARRYLAQIFEALRFCHSNRVIHGDVKEENLLLSKGRIKLCDFDASRETNKDGVIPYTDEINDRRYLPIEQLLGLSALSGAVDIFGAGCVLVKMIGGQRLADQFNSLERQEQLDRMHIYSGPIPQWYYDHATIQLRPADGLGPKGFSVFFESLMDRDPSGLALDLLRRTFEFDQLLRISALMAVNHPFFFAGMDEKDEVEELTEDEGGPEDKNGVIIY